jgi:hypothetical protein
MHIRYTSRDLYQFVLIRIGITVLPVENNKKYRGFYKGKAVKMNG